MGRRIVIGRYDIVKRIKDLADRWKLPWILQLSLRRAQLVGKYSRNIIRDISLRPQGNKRC